MNLRPRLIVVALAALTLATGAQAAIPVFATNTTSQSYTDAAAHLLILKNSGENSITFNSAGPTQKNLISFAAECQVIGTVSKWADLDILVDGTAIAPSNGDNAFCSGGGAGIGGGWSSNVVNVIATGLSQGTHTITVTVKIAGFTPGDSVRIDDSTLVVVR